jgi:hypothetical protein
MTNKTNSNIINEHIHALLNIVQNNGDINLSPFDDHLNFDNIITENAHLENEKNITTPYLQLDQNEQPFTMKEIKEFAITNEPNESVTKDPSETANRKNPTNDMEKKLSAPSASDGNTSGKHYHYGVKKSSTPSTFKKYQPPFTKKQTNFIQNPDDENMEKTNQLDNLIISLLNNKNKMEKDTQNPGTQHQHKSSTDMNKHNDITDTEELQYLNTETKNINETTKKSNENPYNNGTDTSTPTDTLIIKNTIPPTNVKEYLYPIQKGNLYSLQSVRDLTTTDNDNHIQTVTTHNEDQIIDLITDNNNKNNNLNHHTYTGNNLNNDEPDTSSIVTPHNTNHHTYRPGNKPIPLSNISAMSKDFKSNYNKEDEKNNHKTNQKTIINPYKKNHQLTLNTNDKQINTIQEKEEQFSLHRNNVDDTILLNIQSPIHQLTHYLQTSDNPNNNNKKTPKLTPDLECLRTVIMSQHNALSQHIIDLGTTCLKYTNTIEKKKDSSTKLINDGIIPRSLRIKCDLITSPDYEGNPNFIQLKQELQTAVSQFMNTGLDIMKKWSIINIDLLIKDRCNNVMKIAITILNGLYSYWEDVTGPANWPNDIKKNVLLLILKIYFETDYIPNTTKITDFFEIPPSEILLICSKIITKNPDDIYNQSVLVAMDQIQLNFSNHNSEQLYILQETLKSFDSILKATTIQLWKTNLQHQREIHASIKFKAKMEAERISSATTATEKAIHKAIETIDSNNNANRITELRIHNLEKQLSHQKQTSNEIINELKRQNKREGSTQIPYNIPKNPFTQKKRDNPFHHPQYKNYNTEPYSPHKKRRGVQWDNNNTEITEYNPSTMPFQTFSHSKLLQSYQQKSDTKPPSKENPIQINPFSATPPQTTPFRFIPLPSTPTTNNHSQVHPNLISNNPFLNPRPISQNTIQRYQGGRLRGDRRGTRQKP